MMRSVAVWIAYVMSVVVLTIGIHVLAAIPSSDQDALPLGAYTWFALWCLLGAAIPVFVWLSQGYPTLFVVITTTICVLSWLSLGMRYAPIVQIGFLNQDVIEWLCDILNIASMVVLAIIFYLRDKTNSKANK